MKQAFCSLCVFVALILIGCKNGDTNSSTDSTTTAKTNTPTTAEQDSAIMRGICDEAGMRNLFIGESAGTNMIRHFVDIFKTPTAHPGILKNMRAKHWVNFCFIKALADFFDNNSQYDGVRIIFVALPTRPISYSIAFVPTRQGAINPQNGLRKHTEDFTVTIPGADCVSGSAYMLNEEASQRWSDSFGAQYRGRPRPDLPGQWDALSTKVWIHNCVIKSLRNILQLPSNAATTDGANIVMAAYSSRDLTNRRFQDFEHQSTVIFVAASKSVNPRTGERDNVWNATERFVKILKDQNKWDSRVAFNHGELCPNACN